MTQIAIGTVVDVVAIRVEQGKVREFARASGTTDPVHTDADAAIRAGFPGVPATLTHSVVTGHVRDQRAFVESLGLDLARVVVGSVAWDSAHPLVAGDALTATRRVEGDEHRSGRSGPMRLVTLATEFRDQDGAVVLVQREVLIERGAAS